jgi:type IV pilus assembly protein PilC
MQFVCRLGLPDGRVVEEVHQARDEPTLRQEIERRGLHLFEARPRGLPRRFALPRLSLSRKALSDEEFLIFNQELASLLKAGLPLVQSLDLMLERRRDDRFRQVLSDVRDRVKAGEELSDAFADYGDLFPRLYPATLKAGERSGELEQVIRRFIRYLKLMTEARKKVVSALIYPAVLIGLSIIMLTVLSVAVVPKFQAFFADLQVTLPLLTRITLGISGFLVDNLPWIFLALVTALTLFLRWRATPGGRYTVDRLKLRVPLVGPVLHRFALSEFCRSLATLLRGGIPLVSSFEIGTQAVGNAFIRRRIEPTIQRVREGEAFHSALERSGVFEALTVDMVQVGEATGALDEMLTNVSDFLDEQVETRLARMLALVEPLMLVALGLIIGLLLASIYLPLLSSLSQSQT